MKPVWLINYENEDVSDELGPMTLSCEYVDHLNDKSDELRLTVEDKVGRWRTGWWPSEGDRLTVQMGIEGSPLLDAGSFSVVDIEARGAPDTVTINALAAPKSPAMRTPYDRGFDETSLDSLVELLAHELDLEVLGDIAPIALTRVSQQSETNLALLRRMGRDYGYAFSIRPPHLVFYSLASLETSDPVMQLGRSDMLSGWNLKGTPQDTYSVCELTWFDAQSKSNQVAEAFVDHARERLVIPGGGQGGAGRTLPNRTLRRGVTGDDVREWQTFLVSKGIDPGPIDGIFGEKTHSATWNFQSQMQIARDGVVGPETMRAAVEAGYLEPEQSTVRYEVAGRVLRITRSVETEEQAEAQAAAELARANRLRVTGTLPLLVGDHRAVAGATLDLRADFGRFAGRYLVQQSTHVVSRSGYTAKAEVSYV